jgi:hypothetical protein
VPTMPRTIYDAKLFRSNCQLRLYCILVRLAIFALLGNVASVSRLARRLFYEQEKLPLPVLHKSREIVCSRKCRINKMGPEIRIQLTTLDRWSCLVTVFQLRHVLGRSDAPDDAVGPIG